MPEIDTGLHNYGCNCASLISVCQTYESRTNIYGILSCFGKCHVYRFNTENMGEPEITMFEMRSLLTKIEWSVNNK